jgi:VIT1/CCC1 family predicted Fe2+/Mn2+ transporter
MDQQPSEQTGPTAPQSSLMGRLANVYAAPGEVFEQVACSPFSAANWVAPALIFILAGWLGAWLIFSQDSIKQQLRDIAEQAIQRQVDKGRIGQQQADAARQAAEKFGNIGATVGAAVAPVFTGFVSPFLWGLVVWLVGTKVLKGAFPYMKAVEVAGLANMITVLGSIVHTLLILMMGNMFASPSLMLLVKDFDPQNTSHSVLAAINIMTFWALAVKAVGLSQLSGASFGKAAAWVFGIWAAWMGLTIGIGAAIRAAFGG